MADVKSQLQRIKKENAGLESELRSKSVVEFTVITTNSVLANLTADQKARLLERKMQENVDTIEQLRQERSLLAADHRKLQQRYTEVSDVSFAVEYPNRLIINEV